MYPFHLKCEYQVDGNHSLGEQAPINGFARHGEEDWKAQSRKYVSLVYRKATFTGENGNADSTVADYIGMSADGNRVQQKKRDGSVAEGYESSDEHGEGLLETSRAATSHPKKANTSRKPESTQFSRTVTCEDDTGRLDSQ